MLADGYYSCFFSIIFVVLSLTVAEVIFQMVQPLWSHITCPGVQIIAFLCPSGWAASTVF